MPKPRPGAGIERTVKLLAEFQKGKMLSRADIAALLGVEEPAADYQRKVLAAHFPIERKMRGGKAHWVLLRSPNAGAPPSKAAVIAACLGSSMGELFIGTDYQTGMRDARRHLVDLDLRPTRYDDADRKFVFLACGGEIALPKKQAQMDEIFEALLGSQVLRLEYGTSKGKKRKEDVEPLSFAVYQHQFYLVARAHRGHEPHLYRFSRLENVSRTTRSFAYPPSGEYLPSTLFSDCFGVHVGEDFPLHTVELLLTPKWWPIVQGHRWHASQVSRMEGGKVHLELKVRVCPELESWILGFCEQAEVVSPSFLRTRIAKRKLLGGRQATAQLKKMPRRDRQGRA